MTKPPEPKPGNDTHKPTTDRSSLPVLVRVTRADRLRIAALLGR